MKTKAFKEGKLDFIGLNYYFSSVSTQKKIYQVINLYLVGFKIHIWNKVSGDGQ